MKMDLLEVKMTEFTPILLKTLIIRECEEFEELIASEEAEEEQVSTEGSNTASPTLLESLVLSRLPKLKTLFSKPMMSYFQNVKELEINECDGLKYLFSFEMLEHLKHLQNVDIGNCEELEAVIAEAEVGGDSTILLPSLTSLELIGLPKLKSICRRGEMVCESLQTVKVVDCAKLKRLPLLRGEDQLPPPSLKRIQGRRKWWDSLEWDSPFLKTILQPYFEEDKDEWEEEANEDGSEEISQHPSSVEGQLNSQYIQNLSGEDVLQAPTTTAASLLPMTSEQNNTLNQKCHDKLFHFDPSQHPVLQGGDRDGDGDDGVIDGGNLQGGDGDGEQSDQVLTVSVTQQIQSTSGENKAFRGVRKRPWGKFGVEIRKPDRSKKWLGTFDIPIEAARTFDQAASQIRGAQATLNFPDNFRNSSEHAVPPPAAATASTSRERTKDIKDKGKAPAEEKLIQR